MSRKSANPQRWLAWSLVLSALAATLWLAGPRAATVLSSGAAKVARNSPLVDLDRVGFLTVPTWLEGDLLTTVARDLSPWLSDRIAILDEVSARSLRDGLRTLPWVDEVALEQVFPDRFRVKLSLRQPRMVLLDAEGQALCLLDAHSRALPLVHVPLPRTRLLRSGGSGSVEVTMGSPIDEPRVRAAVQIAMEWQQEIAGRIPACPQLLEVDANNLGERWRRGPQHPEVRVLVLASDGTPVTLAYGRPVDSPLPRVPARTKAQVLANLLQARPGLRGVTYADLRLARRWADYLEPRLEGVPDPLAPWRELDATPR